jgi:hypothetical protein
MPSRFEELPRAGGLKALEQRRKRANSLGGQGALYLPSISTMPRKIWTGTGRTPKSTTSGRRFGRTARKWFMAQPMPHAPGSKAVWAPQGVPERGPRGTQVHIVEVTGELGPTAAAFSASSQTLAAPSVRPGGRDTPTPAPLIASRGAPPSRPSRRLRANASPAGCGRPPCAPVRLGHEAG